MENSGSRPDPVLQVTVKQSPFGENFIIYPLWRDFPLYDEEILKAAPLQKAIETWRLEMQRGVGPAAPALILLQLLDRVIMALELTTTATKGWR